jgi:peptide deformylase
MPFSIRRFPDPILKRPTHPVKEITPEVQRLIDAMIRVMREQPRCVGIAAPQVGNPLRVAVMDASAHPKAPDSHGLLVLVNPTVEKVEGATIGREGCLSVPDFTANVRRPQRLRFSALDRHGLRYEMELEGFEAVVAQHEIDHLDGMLFLDRVANPVTDVFRRKKY